MIVFKKIKLGMNVKFIPCCYIGKKGTAIEEAPVVTGVIIHINRQHKWFTARYVMNGHDFLESFKYVEEGDLCGRC